MSILVKNMEMPKNCDECEIKAWDSDDGCYRCPFSEVMTLSIGRQNDCPLIEFPQGKWILHNMGFGFTHHCSNCHFEVKEQWIGFYNFCPNCGADMREKSEDIPIEYFESGDK